MARGFTLIEMLVVVVIIGILTTGVALTISDNPRQNARHEAQRLAQLLEIASHEARAGQRLLAWSAHEQGYDFFVAENNSDRTPDARWQALTDDPMFRPRTLEAGVKFGSIQVEGQPLSAGGLLIFRRGDPPLFRIQLQTTALANSASPLEIKSLPSGRVVLEEDNATPLATPNLTDRHRQAAP